jgi:hypothetical protein
MILKCIPLWYKRWVLIKNSKTHKKKNYSNISMLSCKRKPCIFLYIFCISNTKAIYLSHIPRSGGSFNLRDITDNYRWLFFSYIRMDSAPIMSETPHLPPQQTTQTSAHQRRANPIVITANTALSGTRLKNFYLTNAFQGFVWMIFHFSVVFFFTFQLQSVALV